MSRRDKKPEGWQDFDTVDDLMGQLPSNVNLGPQFDDLHKTVIASGASEEEVTAAFNPPYRGPHKHLYTPVPEHRQRSYPDGLPMVDDWCHLCGKKHDLPAQETYWPQRIQGDATYGFFPACKDCVSPPKVKDKLESGKLPPMETEDPREYR